VATILPEIDKEKCNGCGECVGVCPSRAVELDHGQAIIARPDDCSYCTECETVCPEGAISCPLEIVMDIGMTA
jgi:NAD-dependent dihydropyrimidine dehydrogenase PreA subunit